MIKDLCRLCWLIVAALMLAAIWLSSTGSAWVNGFPTSTLESLAGAKGLLFNQNSISLDIPFFLGIFPGDGLMWVCATTTLTNVLAACILLFGLFKHWKNLLSPVLAVAVLFGGQAAMWVKDPVPHQGVLHLLLASALVAMVFESAWGLATALVVLSFFSPPHALMLAPALAYLGYKKRQNHGVFIGFLSLLVGAVAIILLAPSFRPQLGMGGLQPLTILPALVVIIPSSSRRKRGWLYLCLLLGSILTARPELASALALGELVATADKKVAQRAENGAALASLALNVLAFLSLLLIAFPGYAYVHRGIWLKAQGLGLGPLDLARIFSLSAHAQSYNGQAWRQKTPFPELTKSDCELAFKLASSELKGGVCVLNVDGRPDSRRLNLIYALLSQAHLRGWSDSQRLSAPLLLCKLKAKNFIAKGPALIFRKDGMARLASAPAFEPDKPMPLDFRDLYVLPYRLQELSTAPGASYTWVEAGQTYLLFFAQEPAAVVFSSYPGKVSIASPEGAKRSFMVDKTELKFSLAADQEALIASSPASLDLTLINEGKGAVSSDMLTSWRFGFSKVGSSARPAKARIEKSPRDFVLFPGESLQLRFQLQSPEVAGDYRLSAQSFSVDGVAFDVPFAEADLISIDSKR